MTAAHSAAIESAPHAWNFYGIARENSTLGQTDYRRTGDPPSAIRPTYIGVVVRLPIGISPNAPDETRGGLEGAFCCARGRNQTACNLHLRIDCYFGRYTQRCPVDQIVGPSSEPFVTSMPNASACYVLGRSHACNAYARQTIRPACALSFFA